MTVRSGKYGAPGEAENKRENLLDPVGKYGEADENTYAAVQVPDRRIMFEHLGAQKNGEAHHAPHEGVKPWRNSKERLTAMPPMRPSEGQACPHIPERVL